MHLVQMQENKNVIELAKEADLALFRTDMAGWLYKLETKSISTWVEKQF